MNNTIKIFAGIAGLITAGAGVALSSYFTE